MSLCQSARKIADVIAFCGGYKKPPKKILMGGPMMGIALASDQPACFKAEQRYFGLCRGGFPPAGADGVYPLRPLCKGVPDEPGADAA